MDYLSLRWNTPIRRPHLTNCRESCGFDDRLLVPEERSSERGGPGAVLAIRLAAAPGYPLTAAPEAT
jgi:hypothetical protein